jgi:hypothetical protein
MRHGPIITLCCVTMLLLWRVTMPLPGVVCQIIHAAEAIVMTDVCSDVLRKKNIMLMQRYVDAYLDVAITFLHGCAARNAMHVTSGMR